MQSLINKILLGDTKIAGFRTIIINTLLLIIGLWDFLSKKEGLFDMLCDTGLGVFMGFCTISETQFYLTAVIVVTALNNVLRWLTVGPAGLRTSPAELRIAYEDPDGGQRLVSAIAFISIGVIVGLLITWIV